MFGSANGASEASRLRLEDPLTLMKVRGSAVGGERKRQGRAGGSRNVQGEDEEWAWLARRVGLGRAQERTAFPPDSLTPPAPTSSRLLSSSAHLLHRHPLTPSGARGAADTRALRNAQADDGPQPDARRASVRAESRSISVSFAAVCGSPLGAGLAPSAAVTSCDFFYKPFLPASQSIVYL